MLEIVLATNNPGKLAEVQLAFKGTDVKLHTLKELGVDCDPIENADTYLGNALIKANEIFELTGGMPVIADDSGLSVDCLGGKPGVHSARYAGDHVDPKLHMDKLLDAMKDVTDLSDRTASFITTTVYKDSDRCFNATGVLNGVIGFQPIGDQGFGYDPLFLLDAYDRKLTIAQLSLDDKNKISHRIQAFKSLIDMI